MGKSETMDDALASFAMSYSEQTKRDYARLVAARTEKVGATPKKNGKNGRKASEPKKAEPKKAEPKKAGKGR